MVEQKHKGRTIHMNPEFKGAPLKMGSVVTPGTGLSRKSYVAGIRRERITLTAAAIAILAANDYGSLKIADFPTSNILIVGALFTLTCTGTGGVTDLSTVSFGLGTAAAASADLSGAGEKNIIGAKTTSAGGASTGVAHAGLSAPVATATPVYLNTICAISSDGSVVVTGTVDILYIDLESV